MHSFVFLTLASSVFALPLYNDILEAPVKAYAPVKRAADTFVKAATPVKTAVGAHVKATGGDVDPSKVNTHDKISSGKHLHSRGGADPVNIPDDFDPPTDAAQDVYGKVHAPHKGALDTIGSREPRSISKGSAKVHGPIDTTAKANGKVVAPVKATVGNKDVKHVKDVKDVKHVKDVKDVKHKVANGIASGHKVSRDIGLTPPTLPIIIGTAQTNVSKVVDNIKKLLTSYPTGPALCGPLEELNTIFVTATNELDCLKGLTTSTILRDGDALVSTLEASEAVAKLYQLVADVLQEVTKQLGTEVSELHSTLESLNYSMGSLFTTVTSLIPDISSTLCAALVTVVRFLKDLDLGVGLSTVVSI